MELKSLSVAASRPLANFHPTVWVDRFLVSTPRPVPRLNQSIAVAAAARPLANYHPTVCTDRFLIPTPRPVPRLNRSVAVAAAATSRPLANFHPSVWGDRFLIYTPDPCMGGEQEVIIEELKEEVKRELKEASNDDVRLLKLVDEIQRLGIEYHFEEEIDEALQNLSQKFEEFCKDNDDMYTTSLAFRLLRQQGYRISCRIFDKFKDDAGGFKVEQALVAGALQLFEATHLRVHDEEILDDAYVFTRNHLETLLPSLSYPIAEQVHHALHQHSNRRGLPRVEARHFISIYDQFPSHHQGLLRLAKLDFNMLQSMHKRELAQLQRWWNDLEVPTKLAYARDRLVETYFWVLGVYFEPKYSLARVHLTKLQMITSLLDDTYDAYATFQELQLFTQAFESWSYSSLEKLPDDALKIIYKATLVAFEEFEEDLIKHGIALDRLNYGIEAMKMIARNYFAEAKWREEKYTPTSEEYMEVATVSTSYASLIIMSLIGMGDEITKETFDFVLTKPKVVRANLIVCRLTDDIRGHEFDREREHVPSWVECYTEEHQISEKEADLEFKARIESAWKDINEAFLKPTQIPASALVRILNFTRVMEVMYCKGDWYTHVAPEMQTIITQLLIDPVP